MQIESFFWHPRAMCVGGKSIFVSDPTLRRPKPGRSLAWVWNKLFAANKLDFHSGDGINLKLFISWGKCWNEQRRRILWNHVKISLVNFLELMLSFFLPKSKKFMIPTRKKNFKYFERTFPSFQERAWRVALQVFHWTQESSNVVSRTTRKKAKTFMETIDGSATWVVFVSYDNVISEVSLI